VISEGELLNDNAYIKYCNNLDLKLVNLVDPAVPAINQIMFTFNRKSMYAYEDMSSEMWKWGYSTFVQTARSLKYEYIDSIGNMIAGELMQRLAMVLQVGIGFGIISIVNALLIRVAIKSSVLIIFPVLSFLDCILFCLRGNR